MYDFEAILSPLNEHSIDNLTHLTGHTPVRFSIHDTLNNESVYLVDENPERLIE